MGTNDLLVLAALLHDIGAFAQRADVRVQNYPQNTAARTRTFIETELPLPAELESLRPRRPARHSGLMSIFPRQ